ALRRASQRHPHADAADDLRRAPRGRAGRSRRVFEPVGEEAMSTTLRRHEMFIDGRWTPGTGGGDQEIVNPATGKVIAHVPKGSDKDVDRAVNAARKAFDGGWSDSTPRDRSERMLKLAEAIAANGDEFARIESENVGKPLAATKSEEIPPIVDCIRFFAGAARVLEGRATGE